MGVGSTANCFVPTGDCTPEPPVTAANFPVYDVPVDVRLPGQPRAPLTRPLRTVLCGMVPSRSVAQATRKQASVAMDSRLSAFNAEQAYGAPDERSGHLVACKARDSGTAPRPASRVQAVGLRAGAAEAPAPVPRRWPVASRNRKHTQRLTGADPRACSQHADAEHLADRTSVTVLHRDVTAQEAVSKATSPVLPGSAIHSAESTPQRPAECAPSPALSVRPWCS